MSSETPDAARELPREIRDAIGEEAPSLLGFFIEDRYASTPPSDSAIKDALAAIFKHISKDTALKHPLNTWSKHCKANLGAAFVGIRKLYAAELVKPMPAPPVASPPLPPTATPLLPVPVAQESITVIDEPDVPAPPPAQVVESPLQLFMRQGSLKRTVSVFNLVPDVAAVVDEEGHPKKRKAAPTSTPPPAAPASNLPPSPLELFRQTGSLRQPRTSTQSHINNARSLPGDTRGKSMRLYLYTQGVRDEDEDVTRRSGLMPAISMRASTLDVEDDVFLAPGVN